MNRLLRITLIILAVTGGMSLLPAFAGADDGYVSYSEFQEFGTASHKELFPKFAYVKPNGPERGNGALTNIHVAEGALKPTPQGQNLLLELGGTWNFDFTAPTMFQVQSPVENVEVTVDGRPYAPTDYLTQTATAKLVITVKKGQDASQLRLQLLSAFPTLDPFTPAKPMGNGVYHTQTNHNVESMFAGCWSENGGLPQFGYALSEPGYQLLADGNYYLVQYFERHRMEYHPENPSNLRILLGQFGREIRGSADPAVEAAKDHTTTYFQETGHNVPEDIMAYWKTNGGLAQFGYPLTEVFEEKLENGQVYEVQYFERARFERHPENLQAYNLLLGQFGRTILQSLANERIAASK